MMTKRLLPWCAPYVWLALIPFASITAPATPLAAQTYSGVEEDEWYDPTDWFDGNNIEADDSAGYGTDEYEAYGYDDDYDYDYDYDDHYGYDDGLGYDYEDYDYGYDSGYYDNLYTDDWYEDAGEFDSWYDEY